MKYKNYLKEDAVSKALGLSEPKVGASYPPEKVKRYIQTIDDALTAMKKKEENDANDAIVQDLRDKKKKWSNVKKETKPTKTVTEPPPEQQQDDDPDTQNEPPLEPEPEQQKESKFKEFLDEGGTWDEGNLLGLIGNV